MADIIPQMRLKQATLPQSNFTPIVYTPQTEDLNLLQRSLAQLETRQTSATEQQAKFNETAAKLQALVNPEEKQWVYDYINKQSAGFKSSIESGDYGAALRQATVAGSNLLSTPEAMGRIKNQEKYKEFTDRIIKDNDITALSKERALAQNAYGETEDIIDNNKNIIGVKEWKPLYTPVKNKPITNLAILASKIIAPFEHTTGGTTTINDDLGKHLKPIGFEQLDSALNNYYHTGYTEGGTHIIKRIKEEDLKLIFDALYATDTDAMQSLLQDYDDVNWKLTQLNTQLNNETDPVKIQDINNKIEQYKKGFYNEKGIIMTPEQYMLTKINPILASMAYENRTDIYNKTDTYSDRTPKTSTDDLPENLEENPSDDDSGIGAPTIIEGNPPQKQSGLELASFWIKSN